MVIAMTRRSIAPTKAMKLTFSRRDSKIILPLLEALWPLLRILAREAANEGFSATIKTTFILFYVTELLDYGRMNL